MRKIVIAMMLLPVMVQAQTLEECQRAAEQNYPRIRQYNLIAGTTDLNVDNIQKGWLPQISAQVQGTFQSDVMSWPDQMSSMLSVMGVDLKGLKKDQYKLGVEVNQMVYDGGAIKSQKEIAKEQGNIQTAQNEVYLYNVRKRVNEMYFGLLLIDEHIKLNYSLEEVLTSNEQKLSKMYKGGTAAESDYLNVKAERLNVMQQTMNLQSQRNILIRMLSTFCGIEVKKVVKPKEMAPANQSAVQRPELKVIDMQLRLYDMQEKALNTALRPKLGVFAQGYYGYPGYNMFEDMMSRRWSLYGMIGARLSWNIGAFYTRKNDKAKIRLQREEAEVNRDIFLFNNNLEWIQQNEDVARYRKLMTDDEEIIRLRSNIRKAAESKLSHGIIDVNDLVREINNENAARVQQSVHEIEMLKAIYDLKYTVNQ